MDIFYEMIINWTKPDVGQLQRHDFNHVTVCRLQRLHWKKGARSGFYEASRMYVHLILRSSALICQNSMCTEFNNGI
jgi:hypothetical protein